MKVKISSYQLFSAMVLMPYGSAILFFLVPDAKQDAWITMIIYILSGILLQFIYTNLFYKYPEDTLVTYMPKIWGKFIGKIIGGVYILYFTYIAARVLRDFIELILIFVMPKMNIFAATILFMSSITYGAYKGLENLVRAAQTGFIFGIIILVLEWLLLLLTPDLVHFNRLLPVLENGVIKIIKDGLFLIFFPYGETVAFTMIYPSCASPSKVRKAAFLSIAAEGIIISIYTIMFIVSLGINFATVSLFPLLGTIRSISVGFLSRLDILVILVMMLGGFFKISILMYTAMLGTSQLIKMKSPENLAWPFAVIVILASLNIASNYPQHMQRGLITTPIFIHLPLQVIIPVLTLIVYYLRKGIKKSSK